MTESVRIDGTALAEQHAVHYLFQRHVNGRVREKLPLPLSVR